MSIIKVNIDDDGLMRGLSRLIALGRDAAPVMRGLAGIMRSAAEEAVWPPVRKG